MQNYYLSIISEERVGAIPAILRALFTVLSWFYTLIVNFRNWLYDTGRLPTHKLPVPVIAVGNITTGGTGKTPTVILLVKLLEQLGHRPAVLTRGYGAKKGQVPDEVLVIQEECRRPDGSTVPVIVNPDRVAGGRTAISEHHATILILDDGFQHRRLHRDLNIVLVDATSPLGIPGVLPRGSWREPPSQLKRANTFMLTRCEQVTPELADLAASLLTQWVSPRDIYQQSTHVVGLFDQTSQPVTLRGGERVVAFAGIGNPKGFLHTLGSLKGSANEDGIHVVAACWFDDHHNYRLPTDLSPLEKISRAKAQQGLPVDAWVTTLKDFVKIAPAPAPYPLWHLRIEARLQGRGVELLTEKIRDLSNPPRP